MQGIFKALKRKIDVILGLYVFSGNTVFTITDLNEKVEFDIKFKDIDY